MNAGFRPPQTPLRSKKRRRQVGKREAASEKRRSKKQQSHDDHQSNPCNISFNTAGREKALQLFRRRLLPNLSLCRASATLISSSLISLPATQAVSQSRRSRFQTGISIQVCKQTSAMRDGYKNRHKAKGTFIRFFFFFLVSFSCVSYESELSPRRTRQSRMSCWTSCRVASEARTVRRRQTEERLSEGSASSAKHRVSPPSADFARVG